MFNTTEANLRSGSEDKVVKSMECKDRRSCANLEEHSDYINPYVSMTTEANLRLGLGQDCERECKGPGS